MLAALVIDFEPQEKTMLVRIVRFMRSAVGTLSSIVVLGLVGGGATATAGGVVGTGTPASCTDSALGVALSGAGLVTFNCGASSVLISVNTHVIGNGETTTVDGGDLVTLDGGDTLQHFFVLPGGNLTLRRIGLNNGRFSTGGSILNQGTVTLDHARLSGNHADGGSGGGVYNDSSATLSILSSQLTFNGATQVGGGVYNLGILTVDSSRLANNTAGFDGGAILNNGGSATIRSTTLSVNLANNGGGIDMNGGDTTVDRSLLLGNEALVDGGGIRNFSGTLNVINSTLIGNLANRGGGIHSEDSTSLLNSTLHINHAFLGGAFFHLAGPITVKNSILSLSLEPHSITAALNCDGFGFVSSGHNISSDNSCSSNPSIGDQPATDPLLGPIADNFGPTQASTPLASSTAIDRGDDIGCPIRDQRGAPRPLDGDADGLAKCDIGAIEVPEPSFSWALGSAVAMLSWLTRTARPRSVVRRRSAIALAIG